MRFTVISTLTLAIAVLFGGQVQAQGGNNNWANGYPKTGVNMGEILVKGTLVPPMGWTPTGTGLIVAWPKNGGQLSSVAIAVDVMTGNWGEAAIGGLASGADYNVIVQANVQQGAITYTIATPVSVATAK